MVGDDPGAVFVLARLLHASAWFGASVDELVRLAVGHPVVLATAIAMEVMSADETDPDRSTPRVLVLERLRGALAFVDEHGY